MRRWEYNDYEILQVVPCSGVLAVYAMPDVNEPGKYRLEGHPIHFIAVAKVTTHYMERHEGTNGRCASREYEEADIYNQVVGLCLCEGMFEACNDDSNFAGYCMNGDDITQATGFLEIAKYPLTEPNSGL